MMILAIIGAAILWALGVCLIVRIWRGSWYLLLLGLPLAAAAQPDDYIRREAARIRASQPPPPRRAIRDPLRIIAGRTNGVTPGVWAHFWGEVVSSTEAGTLIRGGYASATTQTDLSESKLFFVSNFPYRLADGESLPDSPEFYALEAGLFQYVNAAGAHSTVRKLEYGKITTAPMPPPPSAVDLEAARILAEKQKAESADKQAGADKATFKFHHDQALAGNVGSQYRLAQLYLAGTGCERDTNAAKIWLKKAADAGNTDAQADLAKLP